MIFQELYHCLQRQVTNGYASTHFHNGNALVVFHGDCNGNAVL